MQQQIEATNRNLSLAGAYMVLEKWESAGEVESRKRELTKEQLERRGGHQAREWRLTSRGYKKRIEKN